MSSTHLPRTLTATEEMRLAAGFVVQPFVAALAAFAGFPLLEFGRDFGRYSDRTQGAISVALGTFMYAIGVTLVVAAPAAIWVVKRRAVTLKRALLYGIAIGNLLAAISGIVFVFQRIVLSASRPANLGAAAGTVVFGSLVGATSAAVFWAISIRGRDFSRDPD